MGRRDGRHGSRLAFWLPVVLVAALLAGAGAAYRLGDRPDPDREPARVEPPWGLDLPELVDPEPVAAVATGTADPAKVRRAVGKLLRDDALGRRVLAMVSGLDGEPIFASGTGRVIPASTLKLLTSAAALATMGPDHTFATTVVAAGPRRIVLVGGGDPLLSSTRPKRTADLRVADIETLARATAVRLIGEGIHRVRVGSDSSLFTGPEVSPHWPDSYLLDGVVAPIQALWVDRGRPATGYGRVDDPAQVAATRFGAALAKHGVQVVGVPEPARAGAGAEELARVTSPPLSRIVEYTVATSDNEVAEVLARQTALATGRPASFRGGATAVLDTVAGLGVPTEGVSAYDGSGLSRDNRIEPHALVALLGVAGAAEHPELRSVITGLPVAGFTGSLTSRFTQAQDVFGRGAVRAKTGTLTGVSGLAGTVTDRTGTPMVFAFLADRIDPIDTLEARATLDALTSALAACRCSSAR